MSNYYNEDAQLRSKILKRFSMFDNAGLDISNCSDYRDALQGAGLDYTVKKVPIYLEGGIEIPNKFSTIREDDPTTSLGIVGKDYVPVNNETAFEIAQELVDEGKATYEVGGVCIGAKNRVDYSRSFMVLRGEDFEVGDDVFNSFIVFNNSFDCTSGVLYKVICQRVVCLNGMVRFLGGKKNQLFINIQHSRNAVDKIQKARSVIFSRMHELEAIKREAEAFQAQGFTRQQFEKEIIPLVLKEKGLVKENKERQKGQERIEKTVSELIQAYNADDTQNYNNSMYKVILALSDYETHASPLRDTGNGQIYMNRVLKGMALTTAVAQYLQSQYNVRVRY